MADFYGSYHVIHQLNQFSLGQWTATMALDWMYYYNMLCLCMCVFLAQKIHISENAKEALEEIGSYHIVFRGSMKVKVNWHYCNFYLLKRRSKRPPRSPFYRLFTLTWVVCFQSFWSSVLKRPFQKRVITHRLTNESALTLGGLSLSLLLSLQYIKILKKLTITIIYPVTSSPR